MSYKDETTKVLVQYYNQHGLEQTIETAYAMLKSGAHKNSKAFFTSVHGEITEAILVCIITDFMIKNPDRTNDWKLYKVLIVKSMTDERHLTEIDVILSTPQRIFIFECKCYGGDKDIIERCTIRKREDHSTYDVYSQNHMHAVTLDENLSKFRLSDSVGSPGYQLILFNFSLGKTNDSRTTKCKLVMPCLNERNVMNIVQMYTEADKPIVWNSKLLNKALDIIQSRSEDNRKRHLEYVKSIRR